MRRFLTAFKTSTSIEEGHVKNPLVKNPSPERDRIPPVVYAFALAASIAIWFVAVRSPLWLDETFSFWQIKAGFWHIPSRGGVLFVAYPYVLWFATKLLGTSEVALRIPSIVAMLGAVYLLYRAARELFGREFAFIVCIVFCSHPIIIFASVDVRAYAFATLAMSACIFLLVRLRNNDSNWLPALLGLTAAVLVWFHFLFAVFLPALLAGLVILKAPDRKTLWRQLGVSLLAFTLAFWPLVPGYLAMFHTRGTHVFQEAPPFIELVRTVAPAWQKWLFALALVLAVLHRDRSSENKKPFTWVLCCVALAAIPLGILFGVSAATPIHIFVVRYRTVTILGIALAWGLIISRIGSPLLRVALCCALVLVAAGHDLSNPISRNHGFTWKYALEAAERNAESDNAPVVVSSDYPESSYAPMPVDSAKDSGFFAPLSYYPLSVPVVPLPRALNDEAIRVASAFLNGAGQHRRFLAMAFWPSYPNLDWIRDHTLKTHSALVLGNFDGVVLVEFTPLPQVEPNVQQRE
jgi:hypothetical protein